MKISMSLITALLLSGLLSAALANPVDIIVGK